MTPESPAPAALDAALLHRVVKAAFGHRRKTLNNTLVARAAAFGFSPEEMRAPGGVGLDQRRGETLSVAEFVALGDKMAELRTG